MLSAVTEIHRLRKGRDCGCAIALLNADMPLFPAANAVPTTVLSITIGSLGAGLALVLNVPAWALVGPALAVSIAGLARLKLNLAEPVRDICLVVLGLGVGAGFDSQVAATLMRWPLAFLFQALSLVLTMYLSRLVLVRGFGFDSRSACLTSAPGHLSFALGLAVDLKSDVAQISVVQSIRLLFLTISVPFIARAMGYGFQDMSLGDGTPMAVPTIVGLALVSVITGLLFRRLRLPAPLLLAAMTVSATGHVCNLTPGTIPPTFLTPAFVVLGTMIGTRFVPGCAGTSCPAPCPPA